MINRLFFLIIIVIKLTFGNDYLKILTTAPKTGYDSTGIPCLKAMEIAVNAANNDKQFLKGFQVEMATADDGFGPFGVQALANFYRNNVESQLNLTNETSYPSPIVTGFLSSLTCQTVAPILPHLNMAMVSQGCISPIFTEDKQKYRNLFRMRKGVDKFIEPIAKYLKQFKWDKVALFFSESSVVGFNLAHRFMQVASNYNISIVWSNSDAFDKDVEMSLKHSKARVIFITIPSTPLTNQILCQLYKNGFYSPNFIVIALTTAFYEKQFMSAEGWAECTRDELFTMYNIVLFIGSKPFAVQDTGNVSYFDYGFDEYNKRYDELMVGIEKDHMKAHFCHDAMLQSLIALHEANEQMKKSKNMTLRDYLTEPGIVLKEVKKALGEISFKGIRLENYHYSSSENLEFDSEPIVILQWVDGNRWSFPYDGIWNDSIGQYSVEQILPFQWQTTNGKPPKGWPNFVRNFVDMPLPFFISVSSIAIFLIPIEALLLLPSRQILQFIGLLFFNFSAILTAMPIGFVSHQSLLCFARLLVLATGFSSTSISLSLESMKIWFLLKDRVAFRKSHVQQNKR